MLSSVVISCVQGGLSGLALAFVAFDMTTGRIDIATWQYAGTLTSKLTKSSARLGGPPCICSDWSVEKFLSPCRHLRVVSAAPLSSIPVHGALGRRVGAGLDARLRRRLRQHRQPVRVGGGGGGAAPGKRGGGRRLGGHQARLGRHERRRPLTCSCGGGRARNGRG